MATSSYTVWGDEVAAASAAVPSLARDPGPVDTATSNTNHEDGHEALRLRGGGESSEEEEDESSEEEYVVSDIEVIETFDEVEFGGGDESH